MLYPKSFGLKLIGSTVQRYICLKVARWRQNSTTPPPQSCLSRVAWFKFLLNSSTIYQRTKRASMNPIAFSLPAGLGWATSSMSGFVRLQAAQMRWDTIQSTKLAIAAGTDRLWSNGATCSDRKRRMSKNRSDSCQVWRWLSLETDTCWMNGSIAQPPNW
jgi:hypothetical protein